MLPPADVNEELEARLRGDIPPRKKVVQRMHLDGLIVPGSTKVAAAAVVFLFLGIAGWIIATGESTAGKVEALGDATALKLDAIKDQQAAAAIKQAEQSAAIVSRLSAVESEVQGLKSRTEKLEQEIRK